MNATSRYNGPWPWLYYILTCHSRDSTILMFRKSGSNSLGILGLTTEKLFSYLPLRKSLSTWLTIPRLGPPKCDAFQVLGLSFFLRGKCKTMYRKYFHRNLCPEELGFMLLMNFLTTPLAWGLSGILQGGLSPLGRQPTPDKAPQTPNPLFSLHVTSSPSSSKASQLLQQEKLASLFHFPIFKAWVLYCF